MAMGDWATAAGDRAVAIGAQISGSHTQGGATYASGTDSVAIGTRAAATATNAFALGLGAQATHADSVAIGSNSETSAPHTGNFTLNSSYTAAATAPTSVVSVGRVGGERQIQNVAAGVISATSTDAINGSQLYATNNYLGNLANTTVSVLGGNAAVNGTGNITMTNIGGTGQNTIDAAIRSVTSNATNINAIVSGNTYIDANGQLNDGGKQALKTYDVWGRTATENSNVIDAIKNMNEGGIKYFHTNDASGQTTGGTLAAGTRDSSASGSYSTAVGYEASATAQNALAIGRGAQALGISSISIGTGNVVNAARSGAIGDPTTIIASATDSYSIGNNNTVNTADTFVMGNNVTTTVGNSVYLGANAAATAPATAQSAGTTAYNSATINGTTYNYAGGTPAGAVTVGSVGGERRIQNVAAGLISATSTDAINGSQLYTAYEAINALSISSGAGWNLQANGNTTTITPINPTLNVVDGSNTTVSLAGNQLQVNVVNNPTFSGPVTANGGLSVGNNLTVQPGTTVDMGGNRITNVADGQALTDAVTVQQLQNAQMGNAGQVGVLADRIHQVSRNADAGTASAMAMAGLPQAYLPGKSMIAAGASAYRGASAIAVGLSTISDNGKWILKGTISGNNRGHVGAAVGAGYQW